MRVDADGLDVDALLALDRPSAPSSDARPPVPDGRRAGAGPAGGAGAVGARPAALVVEDDYDAEYRYDREPVGALQALAPASSSRRVGVEGARPGAAPRVARAAAGVGRRGGRASGNAPTTGARSWASSRWPTSSTAASSARHLRRTRRRHRDRRDALVAALHERLPGVASAAPRRACTSSPGCRPGSTRARLAAAAAAHGVAVHALHADCAVPPRGPARCSSATRGCPNRRSAGPSRCSRRPPRPTVRERSVRHN